jgi:hypothetical protein
MNKNLTLILFAFLFVCSCKHHEEKRNSSHEIDEESVFKVLMKFHSDKNMNFQMYYMEEGDKKFTENKVVEGVLIKISVPGVEFKLPKKNFPTSLRFDFGNESTKRDFTFVSMVMTYEDLKMTMSLVEFHAFFRPNQYLSFNKENGETQCIVINGKSDPFFVSRPFFNKRLEIEKR